MRTNVSDRVLNPARGTWYVVRAATLCCAAALCSAISWANESLPPSVLAELAKLQIPPQALSVVAYRLEAKEAHTKTVVISHNAQTPRNPASLMKLVTTSAALDLLGPAFTWKTKVFIDGPIEQGTLRGNVYIQGQGDPRFGVEQLWLLMRRIKGLGINSVQGDIVLDHHVFALAQSDPGEFDAEPMRPYNAAPDALLINFKSLLINFVPDPAAKVAHVHVEPPLAGVRVQNSVALVGGDCADYRGALRAKFQDPNQISFAGQYPQSCGERLWPVAYVQPAQFATRAIAAMWSEVGGQLSGTVRDGEVARNLLPLVSVDSAQLAEVIRDINKFSNNVMAQQVFLTLGDQLNHSATLESARTVLNDWWLQKIGEPCPKFDNGSGLSREGQMSADDLAKLLAWQGRQPSVSELQASLPIIGVDGTLKHSKALVQGHFKTGSLKGVIGIAGYMTNSAGQEFIVVAIINHPRASTARPVFDALLAAIE